MSKVIKCNLSVIDLGRAINELKAYENELNDKLQRLVEELMKEGLVNKFDNVTFKSIKPRVNKELNIEKFLSNFKEKRNLKK